MRKIKLSTKLLIAGVSVCFILFLVFVSVLGVNNNVNGDVKNFIQNMSSKNYAAVSQSYSDKEQQKQKSLDETIKFHFALELAMLEYFGLMENSNYSIKVERENLWIPLLTPNELKVSVNLTPQKKSTLAQSLFSTAEQKPLKEFILLVRENEKWKISKINIEGSGLEDAFQRILPNIKVGKYVNITPKGFVLKQTEFEIEKISPLERKLLVHDLQTALEMLHKSNTSTK